MSDELLKECPFCGEDAHFGSRTDERRTWFMVSCTVCDCMTAGFATKPDAVRAWNTRPALTPSSTAGNAEGGGEVRHKDGAPDGHAWVTRGAEGGGEKEEHVHGPESNCDVACMKAFGEAVCKACGGSAGEPGRLDCDCRETTGKRFSHKPDCKGGDPCDNVAFHAQKGGRHAD